MVSNWDSERRLGDFRMSAACRPQPVAVAGSVHEVGLTNEGEDRYVDLTMSVTVRNSSQSGDLLFVDGGLSGASLTKIPIGNLPSGTQLVKRVALERQASGAKRWTTILTTVEFWSWLETDPLLETAGCPYVLSDVIDVEIDA